MNNYFKFNQLTDYDLFHLRNGKGAVIIAVKKENTESAKSNWDESEKAIRDNFREVKKAENKRLKDLKLKLHIIVGDVIRRDRVISNEEVELRKEIEVLENKLSSISYPDREYFTNFQKAMFYTHNLAPTNEVDTRIDPVLKIAEHDEHIEVILNFTDMLSSNHIYHKKILNQSESKRSNKPKTTEINGSVKRIIPKGSVTLEIISDINIELSAK